MGYFIGALLGWLSGIIINHLGNTLPLKETVWQVPFCKRRTDDYGGEFISTMQKDEAAQPKPEPVYCHAPNSPGRWSALVAYLSGQRACPVCGQSMGLRPLAVEGASIVLFVFLFYYYGPSVYLAFVLAYTAILILLTVTDLEHRLIQNSVILPAILLALLGSFFTPHFGWQRAIVGGATGFIVFYALAWLARGSLGAGDVTLAAFLGLITGFPQVILVIFYGILLGGLVSVLLIVTRRVTMKTFIPYGPFLIIAGWTALVWGTPLWAWIWR